MPDSLPFLKITRFTTPIRAKIKKNDSRSLTNSEWYCFTYLRNGIFFGSEIHIEYILLPEKSDVIIDH